MKNPSISRDKIIYQSNLVIRKRESSSNDIEQRQTFEFFDTSLKQNDFEHNNLECHHIVVPAQFLSNYITEQQIEQCC